MKPFHYIFAGSALEDFNVLMEHKVDRILVSYAYLFQLRHLQVKSLFESMLDSGAVIMLDSGAFSAFHSGVAISLQDYIAFVRKFSEYISLAVNLDVIKDGPATYENWKIFREQLSDIKSLDTMNIYHDSDEWKYYRKLMNEDNPHIGLACGALRHSRRRLHNHLRRVFAEKPTQHVHGFALTAPKILFEFPFFSADSTSWIKQGAYGGILVPELEWASIYVSDRRTVQPNHVLALSPDSRDMVISSIEKRGFNRKDLGKSSRVRKAYNVVALLELEAAVNDRRESEVS